LQTTILFDQRFCIDRWMRLRGFARELIALSLRPELKQSSQRAVAILCKHRLVAAQSVEIIILRQEHLERTAQAMEIIKFIATNCVIIGSWRRTIAFGPRRQVVGGFASPSNYGGLCGPTVPDQICSLLPGQQCGFKSGYTTQPPQLLTQLLDKVRT
jgi:hypothetical protein